MGNELGEGYKNMFTDEDDTTLYGTGFFTEDGKPVTVTGDSVPGKVVGAARTLGLTAAEVLLLFSPFQLVKLAKLPQNIITKTIKGAANIAIPGAAVIEGYMSYDTKEDVEDAIKEKEKQELEKQETLQAKENQDAANVGVEGINPDNFEDGRVVGEYLPR